MDREKSMPPMRIGHGYDVHRLVENRRLMMGGVHIPWRKGLLGHSDADVLVHAIADALLGAVGEGDIGRHFPDNDPAYKDADSLKLLVRVEELVAGRGYVLGNLDATIIAQLPKMAPHIQQMCEKIATVLKVAVGQINVKATTEEGLGFSGAGEGIAAHAVALVVRAS